MSNHVNSSCQADLSDLINTAELVCNISKSFDNENSFLRKFNRVNHKNEEPLKNKYLSVKLQYLHLDPIVPPLQFHECLTSREIIKQSDIPKKKKHTKSKKIKERKIVLPKITQKRTNGSTLPRNKIGSLIPLQSKSSVQSSPRSIHRRKYSYFIINNHSIYEDPEP
ncbi:hypothetical protein SteCoe_22912 [Stentor coeruleus]|uniref:Uncharacterized protein n=1 Tax=Stentor coeruleus TaxID=5963 RepID=A0A1R2BL53_9CILI|nr:hypothetical protein SteCoe_22912 [Stentor coeruleus]